MQVHIQGCPLNKREGMGNQVFILTVLPKQGLSYNLKRNEGKKKVVK